MRGVPGVRLWSNCVTKQIKNDSVVQKDNVNYGVALAQKNYSRKWYDCGTNKAQYSCGWTVARKDFKQSCSVIVTPHTATIR